MNSSEKLLYAIGEIDESLIAEAERYRARGGISLYKKLTVAACALIVSAGVVGTLGLLRPVFDKDLDGAAPIPGFENSFINGSETTGEIMRMDFGTLALLGREGNIYTFRLTLLEQTERQDVILRGSGIDQFGEPIFVISTTAPYAELTHVPVAPPVILVNGAPADTLPTAPGDYTVQVDLSPMIEAGYEAEPYFIFGSFGRINR